MQRLLWILLAAIALLLVILVSNGNAPLFGLPSDSIAETAYLGMWGVVIAAGLLGSGIRFGNFIRNMLIWLAIIAGLMVGYHYFHSGLV